MDRREVLPDVREETVEDLKAKWEQWPETRTAKATNEFLDTKIFNDIDFPRHYAGNGDITCKDALKSMMSPLTISPNLAYWYGCAFKYLWRVFLKGDPVKDLMKARQCIDEMLDLV